MATERQTAYAISLRDGLREYSPADRTYQLGKLADIAIDQQKDRTRLAMRGVDLSDQPPSWLTLMVAGEARPISRDTTDEDLDHNRDVREATVAALGARWDELAAMDDETIAALDRGAASALIDQLKVFFG